ncbi:DUF3450 domain-containing protein [Thalassotalea litorea]|uniref:DUF3450 domain-containing protein n=1 Tax=Thalassotalea litorea TaxID=2020715 RepID=UPI003735218D
MKPSNKALAAILISSSVLSFGSYALVNEPTSDKQLNQVVSQSQQINVSAEKSQLRIDKYNEQIQSKLQRFKSLSKEVDGLKVYNQQMQRQLDNQLQELAQIQDSMQQVSIIERQISPLMTRMITTLEQFIALDVPFLEEERSNRIEDLKSMLDRADVSVSEKFRRVLEAYQVETDYGRTIEAYTGLLQVNGRERDVDFLRIGRVSLIYQTRDGANLGIWDQDSHQWQELPTSMRSDINKGLRIARKQLAPDLIVVPVNSAK